MGEKIKMSKLRIIFLFILSWNVGVAFSEEKTINRPMRTVQTLNGIWKISAIIGSAKPILQSDDPGYRQGYWKGDYDDSTWSTIRVPLNWYAGPAKSFGEKPSERPFIAGWYRTKFRVSDVPGQERTLLKFYGAGYGVDVYINGRVVGKHQGGYTAFEFDITDYILRDADNVLAVRCDDDFGPWFGGPRATRAYGPMFGVPSGRINVEDTHGGIWKSVSLIHVPKTYVKRLLITPRIDKNEIEADCVVQSSTKGQKTYRLEARVISIRDGRQDGEGQIQQFDLHEGVNQVALKIGLQNPRFWSPEDPHLYRLQITLKEGNRTVEAAEERFGFREFKIVGKDFYLNGKRYPLFLSKFMGYFDEGAAEWTRTHEIEPAIRGGFNIARTMGGPPPKAVLDFADEIGFMIYSEWAYNFLYKPDDIDEHPFIQNNLREMTEWVYEQYNHPSVVMWSMANEPMSDPPSRTAERVLKSLYRGLRPLDKQHRPLNTSGGIEFEFYDTHNYTGGLGAEPWTFMPESIESYLRSLQSQGPIDKPVVIGECVGYGWGGSEVSYPYDRSMPLEQYLKFIENDGDSMAKFWLGRVGLRAWLANYPNNGPPFAGTFYGKRVIEILRWYQKDIKAASPFTYSSVLPTLKTVTQRILICADEAGMRRNIFSPDTLEFDLYIINDLAKTLSDMKVGAGLVDPEGKIITEIQWRIDKSIDGGKMGNQHGRLAIPENLKSDRYELKLVLYSGQDIVSRNEYRLTVLNREDRSAVSQGQKRVLVYDHPLLDPKAIGRVLDHLKINYQPIRNLSELKKDDVLLVPPGIKPATWEKIFPARGPALDRWLEAGGRILFLEQKITGPVGWFEPLRFAACENTLIEPVIRNHPIFTGCTWAHFDSWSGDRGLIVKSLLIPMNLCTLAASAGKATEPAGMAAAEIRIGQGGVLFSQLLAAGRYGQDGAATLYMNNLLTYILGKGISREARELPRVKAFTVPEKRCVFIDLSKLANMGFKDTTAGDGQGGLFDQGIHDIRTFPTGQVSFRGVPFRITDPKTNHGKSCLVLYGKMLKKFPKEFTGVSVNRQALEKLYFLELAYWVKDEEPIARYRVRYTDGSVYEFNVVGKKDVGDWYAPKNLPNAVVAWQDENFLFGVYLREWINPYPAKEIVSIDILSAGRASSLAVVGITGVQYVKPF